MFSEDAMVNMADGTLKSISLIESKDYIFNKFKNPVKVNRIIKTSQQIVQKIYLDNGTDPFYITPDTLFLCIYNNGSYTSEYANIETIQKFNGKLKSSLKIFSKESDTSILEYNTDLLKKDVYTLELLDPDNTESYYICNVITK